LLTAHVEEQSETVVGFIVQRELHRVEVDVAQSARTLKRDRVVGTVHMKINVGDDALRQAEGNRIASSKMDRDRDWTIDVAGPYLGQCSC
jgi:hypothetical protein